MNDKSRPKAAPESDGEEARNQRTRPRRQSGYVVDAEHFRARVLQDALAEGLAATFARRSALLEWARPRPTDFRGSATPADLAELDARLRADAERCRRHAELLMETRADAFAADVCQVLREVA